MGSRRGRGRSLVVGRLVKGGWGWESGVSAARSNSAGHHVSMGRARGWDGGRRRGADANANTTSRVGRVNRQRRAVDKGRAQMSTVAGGDGDFDFDGDGVLAMQGWARQSGW